MNDLWVGVETLSEYLPQVRVSPKTRRRLEVVAARSVAPRLSDHIRLAVERYVAEREMELGLELGQVGEAVGAG